MTDKLEEGKKPEHNMGPGWMLKGDPELAAKVEKAKKKYKDFKKNVGKKVEEEVEIEEAVVPFGKKKAEAPREIGKDDVENAWALKHVAAKDDKISYQHNGVTLHHANGDHTFILGGHQPLFDRDPKGKLQWKDDLGPARRAFKMPTQKATKGNVVSLKKEEAEQIDELKKSTLASYATKATKDLSTNSYLVGVTKSHAGGSDDEALQRRKNRREGLPKAISRLAKEEAEQIDEARINGREYASQGLMHPDHAKMDIHKVSGQHVDFYASKTGDKMQGKVVKNDGKNVHIQAHSDKEIGDGKLHKFKVQGHLNEATTPYYNKPSFLKRMGAAAKQERLAREKKEREAKQVKEAKDGLEGACWKGYTAVGMKDKNGKKVPNCVPVKEETLDEKLNMDKASMGDVIKDFKKSDAPQFKGKSAEKRREMAIAAKLSNEETQMNEQENTMSFKAFLEEGLAEGAWPGTPEYKAKFPETSRGKVGDKKAGAKGTQTVTGTGVKHERDYEKAEKEGDAPESTEKRGRGRPKGSASGARQKGSAPKSQDGVDYTGYALHLPGRR